MYIRDNEIADSIECQINRISKSTHTIYITLLFLILLFLFLLPIIEVDITCQEAGVVRPVTEKTEITSPISEQVDEVFVREGQKVIKDQPILRLRTQIPTGQLNSQASRLSEVQAQIHDLRQLLLKKQEPIAFNTTERKQEQMVLQLREQELKEEVDLASKKHERYKVLFDKGLIAESEYEIVHRDFVQKQNDLEILLKNQNFKWESDLVDYQKEERELSSLINQTAATKNLYEIKSPITGVIDQFRGIYPGVNLHSGQSIAIISPESELCIEVYVSPRNIGYINIGQRVLFQISAFNYHQWGMLEGEVTDISSDYLSDANGSMIYKVKCRPREDYLFFKNTKKKGFLRKGMTVISHFTLSRQSLFSLLYQNFDDWANPTQYNNKSSE